MEAEKTGIEEGRREREKGAVLREVEGAFEALVAVEEEVLVKSFGSVCQTGACQPAKWASEQQGSASLHFNTTGLIQLQLSRHPCCWVCLDLLPPWMIECPPDYCSTQH